MMSTSLKSRKMETSKKVAPASTLPLSTQGPSSPSTAVHLDAKRLLKGLTNAGKYPVPASNFGP